MDINELATFKSPLGYIVIEAADGKLVAINIGHEKPSRETPSDPTVLQEAVQQLTEYFQGVRTTFDLPFSLSGTQFQMDVWRSLQDIPYGQTLTYGELAKKVGRPGSARAVGGAVGANPLPIVIPCHRVMGSAGAITGYSAGDGIPTKKALLDLEGITYR